MVRRRSATDARLERRFDEHLDRTLIDVFDEGTGRSPNLAERRAMGVGHATEAAPAPGGVWSTDPMPGPGMPPDVHRGGPLERQRRFPLSFAAAAVIVALVAIGAYLATAESGTTDAASPGQDAPALPGWLSARWNPDVVDANGFAAIEVEWPAGETDERLAMTQEGATCIHLGTVSRTADGVSAASMTVGVYGATELLLVQTPVEVGCVERSLLQVVTVLGPISEVAGNPPPGSATLDLIEPGS